MKKANSPVLRPVSLRQFGKVTASTLACGMSAMLLASPALAQNAAQTAEPDEVELETLQIKDHTADSNPYATEGAPYKARVSGDNRRVKPLADTPATITVVTQKQMQESGRTDLRTILDTQPGITVGTGENGNAFGDRYIIRGQEAKSDVFVDGMRDPGLQSRETFAVEQIEVTKGPSATFAGRGASGGSVNAITKQASPDYNFNAIDLAVGTDNHYRGTLDSNWRLSDNAAIRANLLYMDEDVPDRAPARHRRFGAALSAYGKVSDAVSVIVDYYHLTVRDRQDLGQAIANKDNGGLPNFSIPSYAQNDDFQNASVNILTGRLRIEPFEGFRIENTARYGTSVSAFTRGANDPVAPGSSDYRINTSRAGWQDIDYFANRLNLAGEFNTGGIKHNLVTGVEYTTYTTKNRYGAINTSNTATVATATSASGYAYTISGAPNCINGTGTVLNAWCVTDGKGNLLANRSSLYNRTGITRNDLPTTDWKVQTMAGYLMDSMDITDWLNISGGVRFDSFDFRLFRNDPVTGTVLVTGTPAVKQDFGYHGTLWGYNAGLSLKPTQNGLIYVAWANGSDINGGEADVGTSCGYGGLCIANDASGNPVYDSPPEKVSNLEVGTKWDLLGNRLLLTAAFFNMTKSDVFEGGSNSYLTTGSLGSGKFRIRGVELGMVGNITDRLSGQVGVTLMKSRVLASNNNNFTALQIAAGATNVGKPISNFANNSVDVQLRYQATDKLAFGGTATYQSEMFGGQPDTAAALNTTDLDSVATTLTPGPFFGQPNIRVPAFTVYGAFIEYKISQNFALRINGLNLTNKKYFSAAYRSGSFAYVGDARTVKLTLSAKF